MTDQGLSRLVGVVVRVGVYGSRVKVECNRCDIELPADKRRVAIVEKGRPVYCSRACQREGSVVELVCTSCGTKFPRATSRPMPKRPFCSQECRNKGNGRERTGDTSPCNGPDCEKPVYRTAFNTEKYQHRFCSRECKWAWLTGREMVERPERPCGTCGTVMRLSPDDVAHDKKFCSPECKHESMRAKPGHRRVDPKTGYAWVYNLEGERVQEHRHVMEQHLGRKLLTEETVHHKAGGFVGRSDNRLENLELWTGKHPKGHRIEDVLAYAREMLARYGTHEEQARYAGDDEG